MRWLTIGVLATVFLAVSCTLQSVQQVPELHRGDPDVSGGECAAVFPAGNWQMVHRLDFEAQSGAVVTLLGVTVLNRASLSCILSTPEGVTLFSATEDEKGRAVVERAIPPFDRSGFAEGLLADVKTLFVEPASGDLCRGVTGSGEQICRYRMADGSVIDVMLPTAGSWRLAVYDADGTLTTRIDGDRASHAADGRPSTAMELVSQRGSGYRLHMRLVDAVRLP